MGDIPELGDFRERLKVLADMVVPRKLHARFDSSDVVQDTLLKAHRELTNFRGESEGELFAWLQRILRRTCIDKVREHGAEMRDASLEVSLQHTFDQSFARLEKLLAADSSSPSDAVKRAELVVKALDALATLSFNERSVVVTYYLHQQTQQETADSLGMSKAAVARLIQKSLKKLREAFNCEIVD